ncbi:hypothetical protein Tco_1289986, partial [Tanacetum coccineum]
MQHSPPNNNYVPQPSFNKNYMQQLMQNPDEINDPTTTMNMALVLMAKSFKLNYSTPTNNNQRISSNPCSRQIAQPGQNTGNQIRYNAGQIARNQNKFNVVNCGKSGCSKCSSKLRYSECRELEWAYCNVMAARAEGNGNGNNANLQQASTSGTQTDKASVYDLDRSAEDTSMEHSGRTVEQHPPTVKETRAYFESLYNNLVIKVEKVNMVNSKMKEANADFTTELARYEGQEKCFEFNQEKFDELENGYRKSVYQEQCLTKKINALHLSSTKQIMTLNEKITNLNNQLSKEKSTVSYLQEEKKKFKDDFETREDELLDKLIQSEKKKKELDNILVKTGASDSPYYLVLITRTSQSKQHDKSES